MNKKYEFGHQTIRQKAALISARIFVLLLLANSIYLLGWSVDTLQDRISTTGTLLVAFWAYSNLMHAKIEIQEIFVPPFIFHHGVEFLVFGGICLTTDTIWTIRNIIELS